MQIVGIKHNNSNKVYFFNPNGLTLNKGDEVVVETAAGLQYGVVAVAAREEKNAKPDEIKPVLRLATEKDKIKRKEIDKKLVATKNMVRERVNKFKLAMKVSAVDFTLDDSKLIIEFTADDRVDFRDLLKDLASTFKTRIELRQIGQRDEVKNKGGLGPCGEICCCARFLDQFEHVSVKMAKTQGISLSPTKINGLCGRLMCCLGYENQHYEQTLRKMPKINSEVETAKGKGTCVYCDVLSEKVSVKTMSNDGNVVIEEYPLEEVKFKREGER